MGNTRLTFLKRHATDVTDSDYFYAKLLCHHVPTNFVLGFITSL